jgi:hypothetical protein
MAESEARLNAKRAQRDRARDAGVCIACCVAAARPNRVTCEDCSVAAYERVKARRAAGGRT